jgi:hypothetical protein
MKIPKDKKGEYHVLDSWLHVSEGHRGRIPYMVKNEARQYMDGSVKIIRGKATYINNHKKAELLMPIHKIAMVAMSELNGYAPSPK